VELTTIFIEPSTFEDPVNETPVRARSRFELPSSMSFIICKSFLSATLSIITIGALMVGIYSASMLFSIGLAFGVLGLWCLFFGYASE
jgi:hypothetical protein